MVAKIYRALIFVLFPTVVFGQSLDLSATSQTSGNNPLTFQLEEGKISINSGSIDFSESGSSVSDFATFGISSDHSKVSLLKWTGEKGELVLLDSSGDTLNAFSTITLADRNSFSVHPFNNGNILIQDKISNFTLYDTFGEIITSVSSSSQSKQGEAVSGFVASKDGETIVVYSPKFKRDGGFGSKALSLQSDGKFKNIFYSNDRYLKDVSVSSDGSILVAITAKDGTDDQAVVMDKYGNELNTFSSDQNLIGASLTEDGEHITLYSGGRVMIYSTTSGERVGATSLRSSVYLADYFPEDNLILALTGNYSETTGVMNGVEFRAINLKKRSISTEEYNGALGFQDVINARLVRLSANKYRLEGASEQIDISVSF